MGQNYDAQGQVIDTTEYDKDGNPLPPKAASPPPNTDNWLQRAIDKVGSSVRDYQPPHDPAPMLRKLMTGAVTAPLDVISHPIKNAPMIGSIAGSLAMDAALPEVGVPVSLAALARMAAAGVGGSTGALARGDSGGDIAWEGAKAAGLQGVGEVPAGLQKLAPGAYGLGLRVSPGLRKDAVEAGLPRDVFEQFGAKNHVTPANIEPKFNTIEHRMQDSITAHDAQNPAAMVDPKDVAQHARDYVTQRGDLANRNYPVTDQATLDAALNKFLAEHPAPETAMQQLRGKRVADSIAPHPDDPAGSMNALISEGIASGRRQSLGKAVPSTLDDLAEEQKMIFLRKAMEAAQNRNAGPSLMPHTVPAIAGLATGSAAGIPAGLATAAVFEAARSPTIMSHVGSGMDMAGKAAPFTQKAALPALSLAEKIWQLSHQNQQ